MHTPALKGLYGYGIVYACVVKLWLHDIDLSLAFSNLSDFNFERDTLKRTALIWALNLFLLTCYFPLTMKFEAVEKDCVF